MTLPNQPHYAPTPLPSAASDGASPCDSDLTHASSVSSKLYEDTTADIILSSAGVQHDVAAASSHLQADPVWHAIADLFAPSALDDLKTEQCPPRRVLSETMAQSKMAFVEEATTMFGYAIGGDAAMLAARYSDAIETRFATAEVMPPQPAPPLSLPQPPSSKPKKRTNLSADAKRLLRSWFDANFHHPYPTEEEKERFRREGGITMDQVNNWFINTRVREWKPKLHKILTDSNTAVLDEMLVKVKAPYQSHEFM